MKFFKQARKFGSHVVDQSKKVAGKVAAVTGVSAAGTGLASAAIPTEVSTALTDAATDSAGVASLFLIAIIGIAAYKLMQRGAS